MNCPGLRLGRQHSRHPDLGRRNSWMYERRTNAKAFAKNVFINQERKLEDRRRSGPSCNLKRCRLGISECYLMTSLAPYGKPKFLGSGGSMVPKLKLKGIDGRAPPGVQPAA